MTSAAAAGVLAELLEARKPDASSPRLVPPGVQWEVV